jgi:hypothetical protein
MGLKRKQMLMRQKGYFEHKLQDRLSFLSGKGSRSPKADKDTLVRKLQANIRAVNKRLRLIADNEKKTEEMAKIKAERAATPQKKQEGGKGEKPKKASEEGKGKKIKAEMKAAPPKAPEGGKKPENDGILRRRQGNNEKESRRNEGGTGRPSEGR